STRCAVCRLCVMRGASAREDYTLSLHDALPIFDALPAVVAEPPLAGHAVEAAAERERGGGEHDGALAEELVAEHAADVERGDAESRRPPVGGAVEPDDLGPVGLGGVPVGLQHTPG